ncbi:alpha/beta hydrolase-fold protein [Kitasatospora atroaurantiaca]|uniref:S-formylglutathione hydrolase FrmB n=1 Tax=Kitasatospora atroaurantiaca TaxID=285545 RepID=A0A561EYG5_9ACTN|nr:alpha/beta hydrolase-fold protein [Kitasatospora atroaurantiaca]TWE20651.1 S-formylglutathione hydrolase FrmB [Kitasatospora atroaurantiaca]
MGLTSHKVLALAVTAAVLAMAAAVWVWPRLARKSWRAVLGRIGTLLATQLAMLAALGLVANNYFAFYSSWDDLLGTGDAGAVTVQSKPGAQTATGGQKAPVTVQTLGREAVQGGGAVGREPRQAGEIQAVRIGGPATGLSTDGYVYLPPQYFQPEYANRKFPAVVVMTGFPGDAKNLLTRLNYPGAALQLMHAGKMQPTVLILMRPSPAMPADTECEDIPGGAQSETYFTKDVPQVVEASYRVSADPHAWGVAGNSTGGYCALKLAMRHPEVFPSAVSMAGYYKAAEDATTGDLFKGSQQRRDEADLMWRLKNLPQPPVAVMLAGSEEGDGNYKRESDAFQAAVKSPMTVSTAVVQTGGHNFQTWSRLLPPSLEWLSQHLKVPAAGA